jgi:hypothetical protein
MGGVGIMAVVGLAFSMVAIRLMMVVENTQIVIVGVVGRQLPRKSGRVVAFTIGDKKFFMLKVGIIFFGKISTLIFLMQEMYLEKTVQGAASTMMNTIVSSNKVITRAATNTRHAARKVKKKAHHYYRQSRQQMQKNNIHSN